MCVLSLSSPPPIPTHALTPCPLQLHADYFHDAMATAAPQARVVAMPDAGFFRDHLTFDGTDYYTPLYKWVFQSMNVTQVDASCLAAYGGITSPTAWHCFFAEYTLPHISSPLFVTQDLVDSWQLTNIERLPCTPYKAGSCTPAELAALAAYRTSMLTALAPLINSPTNGAFLSSCIQHCHQNIGDVWSKELVANYTPRGAFVSWWSGARNVPSILVDGPFGTNAHCFGVPYEGEPTCGMAPPVATLTTIDAGDARFVTPLGRTFAVGAGLGLSWLGGGFRVTHTGKVLRATVTTGASNAFKLSFSQSAEGYMPFQGISWVPASGMNESIVIASGAGTVDVTLNTPADYWARGNSAAVILSLTTDGTFTAAPPAPSRVLHILGDSITAATNIHGGVTKGCADGGYQADASSSWAGILCPFFSASCSTVAVGGKGLVRNCCDGGTKVPQFYTQLRKNDPDNSFAFKDATPDAMIVYLGEAATGVCGRVWFYLSNPLPPFPLQAQTITLLEGVPLLMSSSLQGCCSLRTMSRASTTVRTWHPRMSPSSRCWAPCPPRSLKTQCSLPSSRAQPSATVSFL